LLHLIVDMLVPVYFGIPIFLCLYTVYVT
jgi:hypothetical protein